MGLIATQFQGPISEDNLFSKLLEQRGERVVLRLERDIFQRGAALSVWASAFFGVVVLAAAALIRWIGGTRPPVSYISVTVTLLLAGRQRPPDHWGHVRADHLSASLR